MNPRWKVYGSQKGQQGRHVEAMLQTGNSKMENCKTVWCVGRVYLLIFPHANFWKSRIEIPGNDTPFWTRKITLPIWRKGQESRREPLRDQSDWRMDSNSKKTNTNLRSNCTKRTMLVVGRDDKDPPRGDKKITTRQNPIITKFKITFLGVKQKLCFGHVTQSGKNFRRHQTTLKVYNRRIGGQRVVFEIWLF